MEYSLRASPKCSLADILRCPRQNADMMIWKLRSLYMPREVTCREPCSQRSLRRESCLTPNTDTIHTNVSSHPFWFHRCSRALQDMHLCGVRPICRLMRMLTHEVRCWLIALCCLAASQILCMLADRAAPGRCGQLGSHTCGPTTNGPSRNAAPVLALCQHVTRSKSACRDIQLGIYRPRSAKVTMRACMGPAARARRRQTHFDAPAPHTLQLHLLLSCVTPPRLITAGCHL
jgi:hypothetical protein